MFYTKSKFMKRNKLLTLMSVCALSTIGLQAQTFQTENGNYRLIGEMSNQFVSGVFAPWDSAVYEYNTSNHTLQKVTRLMHTSGAWDTTSIEEITFTTGSSSQQYVTVYLSRVGGAWNPYSRNTKVYNLSGGMLSELSENYNVSTSSYENSNKTTYEYDGNNRLIKRTNYSWNQTSNDWDEGGYNITKYVGTTNLRDSVLNYFGGALSSALVYTYNGQDLILKASNLMLDPVTSLLYESGRTENTYVGTNLTESRNYTYDYTGDSLYNNGINTYSYTNNKLMSEVYQNKVNASASMVNSYRYTYAYDANDNPETATKENYNSANSQWDNNEEVSYGFNSGNYKTYENYELWIAINNAFRQNVERFYHYELKPNIGVKETEEVKISMFPNPTNSMLNVNFKNEEKVNFYVYSLDGKVVKSGVFTSSNNELSVQELPSGVYILQVAGNTTKGSYRFVKI